MYINNIVLKIASRCNLNCSYCYMYNMGDETYKSQPKIISLENIRHLSNKINLYSLKNSDLSSINIVFHGGEPLLVGLNNFKKIHSILKNNINIDVNFSLQTNSILLNKEWLTYFDNNNIGLGISIDGLEEQHDKYRLYHNGKKSYNDVINSIRICLPHSSFGGVLYVVDSKYDPVEIYNNFKSENIHAMNILLPDGHHSNLPHEKKSFNDLSYGKWMIELYEHWKNDINSRLSIIFFEHIINKLLHPELAIGNHLIGTNKNPVICIETNGDIEIIDSLRTCESGITRGNINVKHNQLDDIQNNELFDLYYNSHEKLPSICQECEISNICGGGFLPHRYQKNNKFDNPSIYCNDLKLIINYIKTDLISLL